MLVVAIVITVLGILSVFYIRYKEIKFQKRQNEYIENLYAILRGYYKFMDFLMNTLSDSVDKDFQYKVLKYLHENKIDLTQAEENKCWKV